MASRRLTGWQAAGLAAIRTMRCSPPDAGRRPPSGHPPHQADTAVPCNSASRSWRAIHRSAGRACSALSRSSQWSWLSGLLSGSRWAMAFRRMGRRPSRTAVNLRPAWGRRESASPRSLAGPSEFTAAGTRSADSAGTCPASMAAARRALRIWRTPSATRKRDAIFALGVLTERVRQEEEGWPDQAGDGKRTAHGTGNSHACLLETKHHVENALYAIGTPELRRLAAAEQTFALALGLKGVRPAHADRDTRASRRPELTYFGMSSKLARQIDGALPAN